MRRGVGRLQRQSARSIQRASRSLRRLRPGTRRRERSRREAIKDEAVGRVERSSERVELGYLSNPAPTERTKQIDRREAAHLRRKALDIGLSPYQVYDAEIAGIDRAAVLAARQPPLPRRGGGARRRHRATRQRRTKRRPTRQWRATRRFRRAKKGKWL